MAQITITIPDNQLDRVRDALCAYIGAESTNANAKAGLIQAVRNIVENEERATAYRTVIETPVVPPDLT